MYGVLFTQGGPDAVDGSGVDLGCRRRVGAQRGDVTTDPVQRAHGAPGIRIVADSFTQLSGHIIIDQTGLQVGKGVDARRRIIVPVVAHSPQCPTFWMNIP